jgi:serine/threonine-protein kinase
VYGFIGWCFKWVAATAILLVVMGAAGAYVFLRAISGGEMVTVPTCTNRPITEAHNIIAQEGLELGKQTNVFSESVPEFYVIGQRPEPGKVVRAGRKVNLTVSSGRDRVQTPALVGKSLKAARDALQESRFTPGTVGRIPHDLPPDTVVGQDPPVGSAITAGSEIHLLVSAGSERRTFMPDLRDMEVEQALQVLSTLNVVPIPKRVEQPGAAFDVILDQHPPAGTLIQEGQSVEYTVRASGEIALPDARRRVWANFVVPGSGDSHAIRVDLIDRSGTRRTVYPGEEDYKEGEPPAHVTGTQINIPVLYIDEATVEFYVDGAKAIAYYFKGDAEPIVTNY